MMNTTRRMAVVEAGVSVLAIVVWVHRRRGLRVTRVQSRSLRFLPISFHSPDHRQAFNDGKPD